MIRYVTRWGLTTGIRELEGAYTDDGKYFHSGHIFVSADEAFADLEKAILAVKSTAKKKAESLSAQASRLSAARWEPKIVRRGTA